MIAVAGFAVVLFLVTEGERRRAIYLARASFHRSRIAGGWGIEGRTFRYLGVGRDSRLIEGPARDVDLWHFHRLAKYSWAADDPWKPVSPDPPFPLGGASAGATGGSEP